MSTITAIQMAEAEGKDPYRFRKALRAECLPWHNPKKRWTVDVDSNEHKDMKRVLKNLRN